ncbi:MAG: ThuA domain-containing protein [Methylococcaceae bacterium]
MKKYTFSLAMLVLSIQTGFAQGLDILIFSKTSAFRHSDAINAGNNMFSNVAASNGWNVNFTENSAVFTNENLSQYDAIVWNNVSGDVLNSSEEEAFKSFIKDGGGYLGIHNAADAETNWPWYVDLLGGATFLNHGAGNDQIQPVSINLEGVSDPITTHFQSSFTRTDEWYNFTSNPRSVVDVLLSIDETTLAGPNMGGDHPITWKHEYDGGRAFYTGLGHTESSFKEPDVITMLSEAIKWLAKKDTVILEGFVDDSVILEEFIGTTEPGQWTIQQPYNGSYQYTASLNDLELTGVEPGPNQHLVREGITINSSLPYTVQTKFKILNYGGVKSFAVNFLQDNQPASEPINSWSLNLDLQGPTIKYMGFVNGSFDLIGDRQAPWAVQNQEYIYKIDVNRRLNGDISPKWVTATISKPDGTIMDTFEVDYSKFRWQPKLNEPAKFGLNSHFASWIASDLRIFYSGNAPNSATVDTATTTNNSVDEDEVLLEKPRLLGHWPFDGDAQDFSGNKNHGIEYNNPYYPVAYISSGLEGKGAYTTVNSDPFDVSKFTLMAWIKPDDVSGHYRVIMEKDRWQDDWYGLYQVGNKIHVRWSSSGTTTATSVTLEPNVFTHVAGTFDGFSTRIYINGVLKHTVSGSSSKPTNSKGELRFGITGDGTEVYQGVIDEAKIFGGALNQAEIQFEMDSSSSDIGYAR